MSFLKRFKNTFHITFVEAIIAFGAIATFFILKYAVYGHDGHIPTFLIIFGFIVGTWLAFRPSEWAVSGLKSGSKYVGLSDYVAGILSSIASNLPEAVIAILLISKGKQLIAVITVLSAAGFNTLILGIAILIATIKKKGRINVPEDLEKKEAPIIRWAIVALLMTVLFGLMEYVQDLNRGLDLLQNALLTKPLAGMLFASYVFYLIYLVIVKDNNKKQMTKTLEIDESEEEVLIQDENEKHEKDEEHDNHGLLPIPLTIILLLMGFVGIFFGGETLTWCVEGMLESGLGDGLGDAGIAMLLGAAGAVPEHSIAIISAAKDNVEVGIGNAMGGILQSSLLIFGFLGIIVSITLHPIVLLQLGAIAGALWFVKRCIQDGYFDIFEAIMIILLQIMVFIILFTDMALFG